MRDNLKNEKYFNTVHSWYSNTFKEWQSDYLKTINNDNTNCHRIRANCASMVLDLQRLFYLEYSLGLPKEKLFKNQDVFIEALTNYCTAKGGAYNNVFFLLCLAIIYGTQKEKIAPVINMLTEQNYKDFILDSMANYLMPEFEIRTDELKFKKSFKAVADIIKLAKTDKDEAAKRLKHYLEKEWLNMRKDGMMHNKSHLVENEKTMPV